MNQQRALRLAVWLGRFAVVVALLPTPLQLANAEYIPPSKVLLRTKAYQPQQTNFPRGSYDYQVAWQGIPVGIATLRVGTTYRDGKKMLDVEATARSAGIVSLFYRLNHRSESIFSAQELKPVAFLSEQTENSRFTNLAISFAPNGVINAKITKGKLNSEGKTEEISFKSENATFDPISAAFLARSLPLDPANDVSVDVFNGKDRYLITLHAVGRERISVDGKEYDAIKIEPSVQKLTDTEGEKRVRKVYLWLSADRRDVLKVDSVVRLGAVSAKLVRFVPETPQQPDAVRARRESLLNE
jgi:hypothetical protein